MGRLPEKMLPLQSGVGSIANAVLFKTRPNPGFEKSGMVFREILQDSVFRLIKLGKIAKASGCAFTPSTFGLGDVQGRSCFVS